MRRVRFIGLVVGCLLGSSAFAQTPDSVDGLELWLRADSVSLDGSQLVWNDLSGNGLDAFQNVPASHPTVLSDSPFINGQPYGHFDGTDDHLLVNSPIDVGTVFVVLNYAEPSGVFENFDGVITGQTGGNGQILFIGNTGTSNFFSSGIFGSNILVNGVPTLSFSPTNQWKMIRGTAASTPTLDNLVIGRDRSFPARSWNGGIAEIIIFSEGLDQSETEIVTNYLKQRYTPEIALENEYFPTDFCALELDAGEGFLDYDWGDGSESQLLAVDTGGVFGVSVVSTFGDILNASTTVDYPGNFITSFELCAGQDSLWSTQLDPDNFEFEWQDGSEQATILIDIAGTYQVLITDLEGCSFLSEPVEVTIDAFPDQSALEPISELCEGGVLQTAFAETSVLNFDWSNGSSEPEITVDESGAVSVVITNQNGCVLIDETMVDIVGVSPVAAFAANYDCVENEIVFTDQSESQDGSGIVDWDWVFFEGTESDEQNPEALFPESGSYNVSLQVTTDSGCAGLTQQDVIVPSKVFEEISISNNCAGYIASISNDPMIQGDSIVSVNWMLSNQEGDELESGVGTDFSIQIDDPGDYVVTYAYETDSGCVENISTPISILEPEFCFDPGSINSLTFWLAADSLVETEGNEVSLWGNIRDTTYNCEAVSADSPQHVEDVPLLNSRSAVRINTTGTWLEFDELSSIRTLVMLMKHQTGSQNGFPTLLGHSTEIDFVGANETNLFLAGVASPALLNGLGRVNGDAVPVTAMTKPVQYAIHSIVTTDSLIAQFISKDRNFTNRGWMGDFVEILMFDDYLAVDELEEVEQYLRYKYAPPVDLPTTIEIPYGFCDLEISAFKAYYTDYHWNTGSTDSAITVNESGVYEVSVTDIYGYTSTDSVIVTYPTEFLADMMPLCDGEVFIYDTGLSPEGYQFDWNSGDTTSTIEISEAGAYFLTVSDTNGCDYETPVLNITIDSFPQNFAILYPPTFCQGNSLQLLPSEELIISQTWSTGDTTMVLAPDEEGEVWVEAVNSNGCVGRDTVDVEFAGIAPLVQYDVETLCEETPLTFLDESEAPGGATIIESTWFIDTDTIQGFEVEYTFQEPGNYNFVHEVLTDNGCVGTVEELIYVNPVPQANFEFSLACSDQITLFEDQSTIVQGSISAWTWDFGNGTGSNTPEASAQFENPGIAEVELSVESLEGCSASIQLDVPVYPTPQATFEWSATCEGELMSFQSTADTGLTGPLSYAWNFSGVVASGSAVQHLFSDAGSYEVTHEVWSTIDGLPGCFDEVVEQVMVSEPPLVNFDYSVACAGQFFTLTDATEPGGNDLVDNWEWSISGTLVDTTNSFSYVFDEVGSYPVLLEVETQAGCEGDYTGMVDVGFSEAPQIIFTPEIGLPPLEVEFENNTSIGQSHIWNFGDGGESILESPIHTYTDTGLFHVQVIVFDEAGCFGFDTATVMVIEPYFDVSIESVTCDFQNGQLSVSCVIGNYNNHRLTTAELSMTLGNGTTVSEFWEGDLAKNQLATYTFQSVLNYNPEINDAFVCLEISNPNGSIIDMVPENNQMCKSFGEEAFEMFEPFPNPADDRVSLFFAIERPSELRLQLVQSDGRLISERTGTFINGLNEVQFNTASLSSGFYLIGIEWNGEWHWRKLLINRNQIR